MAMIRASITGRSSFRHMNPAQTMNSRCSLRPVLEAVRSGAFLVLDDQLHYQRKDAANRAFTALPRHEKGGRPLI